MITEPCGQRKIFSIVSIKIKGVWNLDLKLKLGHLGLKFKISLDLSSFYLQQKLKKAAQGATIKF